MKHLHRLVLRFAADIRGQGMGEYAIVLMALMGGGTWLLSQFTPVILKSFQDYMDGMYLILSLPIP